MTDTPTQADRDMAADVMQPHNYVLGVNISNGHADDADLVQAFAAHRIAAEQAMVARIVAWTVAHCGQFVAQDMKKEFGS